MNGLSVRESILWGVLVGVAVAGMCVGLRADTVIYDPCTAQAANWFWEWWRYIFWNCR